MNERKKDKLFWLIILLLLIIIVLLLFFTKFGKIENKYLVPTGNVDIFNIDVDCICNDGECDNKDNNKDDNISKKIVKREKKGNKKYSYINDNDYQARNEKKGEDKSEGESGGESEDDSDDEPKEVYVDDVDGNYTYHRALNIFTNPFYEYTNKIAPGVSNTYYFVVHNNSNIDVKYYVEMYEETSYDINLKYRLRRNGKYVVGDENSWVSANELKTSFSGLDIKDSDKYSLDWKWEYESGDDNKDTYIGENMDDIYKLNIRFYIEQVD